MAFLSALFFSPDHLTWKILTGLWLAAFLVLFVWYYPLKYHKLSYSANRDILVINCGVIYTRRRSMLIQNIQYITILTLPLQRLFGLCTVVFHAAGGSMHLPCVRPGDALLLQEMLTPRGEEDA